MTSFSFDVFFISKPLFVLFWAALGLTFGSFANAAIHRIPRGKSLWSPRSACPRCGHSLPWHENIPLLSYALLRGRCARCREPISPRYPAVELLSAALFLTLYWRDGNRPVLLLMGGILTVILLIIAFIDFEHQVIPDVLSLGLLGAGLASSPANGLLGATLPARAVASLLGAAVGFGLMAVVAWAGRAVWKKEALGGGDIKLMAAVGSFMGWTGVLQTLFWGSVLGAAWVLVLAVARRVRRGSYVPFGPFLAAATWLVWTRLLPARGFFSF